MVRAHGMAAAALGRGQCARTSTCAHARLMARRLALLSLLAVAVAALRPPLASYDLSDSEPDPFLLWDDDYDDSRDPTPRPRIRSTTPITKLILRGKGPKVNVTVKNSKGENNKIVKTTNINIESHTNFIVTKSPPLKRNDVTKRPTIQVDGQYILVQAPDADYVTRRSTKKPTTRRTPSTRRPTTRRTTTRPTRQTPKTTKAPQTRKTTCPPKNQEWLSSFFQDNKVVNKPQNKPETSGQYISSRSSRLH